MEPGATEEVKVPAQPEGPERPATVVKIKIPTRPSASIIADYHAYRRKARCRLFFVFSCLGSWILFIALLIVLFGFRIPNDVEEPLMITMVVAGGSAGFLSALCFVNFVRSEFRRHEII